MALFYECMERCAHIVLDIADIVRDGDFTTVVVRAYRRTSLRTPRIIGTIIPVLNRTQKRS